MSVNMVTINENVSTEELSVLLIEKKISGVPCGKR